MNECDARVLVCMYKCMYVWYTCILYLLLAMYMSMCLFMLFDRVFEEEALRISTKVHGPEHPKTVKARESFEGLNPTKDFSAKTRDNN